MLKLHLATVAVVLMLAHPTMGEIVPKSPEQLQKLATHIVTGTVNAIYSHTESSSDWQTTHFLAEIKVSTVEKGTGLQKDQLVYVRYWTRGWIGAGQVPPSTAGYRGLPNKGDTIRVFLAQNAYDGFGTNQNDGGFHVIGPNGFEVIKAKK